MPANRQTRLLHPSQQFSAPSSIEPGSTLADLLGPKLVKLLGQSLVAVMPEFNVRKFTRQALRGLTELGLMQRGEQIAVAIAEQLPADFQQAGKIVVRSLGPELQATEGNGMAVFFYLPHSYVIANQGVSDCPAGLQACYELTKRFTAEFCIRPFLMQHQAASLAQLQSWASDPNPHVRRLVSEGTRPRLPWGKRLPAFQADPQPTLALLELLKDDPVTYVQRSVANHLGDIFKDNPDAAYATCERWLEESSTAGLDATQAKARRWIIRHALRHPAKKGVKQALKLRERAKA